MSDPQATALKLLGYIPEGTPKTWEEVNSQLEYLTGLPILQDGWMRLSVYGSGLTSVSPTPKDIVFHIEYDDDKS